ncbi:MAG TPA: DinB family protein [Gemmatirosa sp.]|nr:DinB family protein [Gemmatirosa sp.]
MTAPSSAPDPVLALLDAERAHFLAQVARIPVARQSQRPTPDRWSAAEIVEHVASIDRGVAKILALRSAGPPAARAEELADATLTPEKVARVRSRAERFEAPDRVRPTGMLTPEAALEHLADARAALKAAYAAADPVVLDGAVHPHPVIGPLTLRGWFLLAAHHDARHAQQLAELADLAPDAGTHR